MSTRKTVSVNPTAIRKNIQVFPGDGKTSRKIVYDDAENKVLLVDTFNTDKLERCQKYTQALACKLKVDPEALDFLPESIQRAAEATDEQIEALRAERAEAVAATSSDALSIAAQKLQETPPDVLAAATRFLKSKNIDEEILADVQKNGVVGEATLILGTYFVGISRLLARASCVHH